MSMTVSYRGASELSRSVSHKLANAHNLRRTFGEKCSKVVMPAVLQQLMR
ncbi:hypothetical protein [Anatilimnocola aggregata]|nr:hypothetical protein [Anatilimnocola aggregata]